MLRLLERFTNLSAKRCVDPFATRQKKQEVWKCLRRIMDLASARSLESGGDARNDTRLELCAPGLLQVETEERQFSGEPILVFTNNLSEHGVAVIARQPLEIGESQVAFAFWHEGPLYFLGCVRRCQHVGGGFWAIGLELSETISKTELQSLRVLAEKLSPETTWE